MLTSLDVEGLVGHHLLQPPVLVLEGLQPLRLLGLHPAATTAARRCPARQRCSVASLISRACSTAAKSFPAFRRECVTQLRDDLLRLVLLPSFGCHRKSNAPRGRRPSYRLDQDFQGRPISPRTGNPSRSPRASSSRCLATCSNGETTECWRLLQAAMLRRSSSAPEDAGLSVTIPCEPRATSAMLWRLGLQRLSPRSFSRWWTGRPSAGSSGPSATSSGRCERRK